MKSKKKKSRHCWLSIVINWTHILKNMRWYISTYTYIRFGRLLINTSCDRAERRPLTYFIWQVDLDLDNWEIWVRYRCIRGHSFHLHPIQQRLLDWDHFFQLLLLFSIEKNIFEVFQEHHIQIPCSHLNKPFRFLTLP